MGTTGRKQGCMSTIAEVDQLALKPYPLELKQEMGPKDPLLLL